VNCGELVQVDSTETRAEASAVRAEPVTVGGLE
jgi:hypothetical protein